MRRALNDFPVELRTIVEGLIVDTAHKHGVWISELLGRSGPRARTRWPARGSAAVALARGELICALRDQFTQHRVVGTLRIEYGQPVGMSEGDWQPLSYPAIGAILGLDHTACMAAYKKYQKWFADLADERKGQP